MVRYPILLNGIIGLLTFFVLIGIVLTVKALADAHARTVAAGGRAKRGIKQRIRDYVGPIDRSKAPLRPALCVLVEFVLALTGFPGLGWLMSGRIFVGLILLSVVPAFVWAIVPMALSMSGLLLLSPYSVVMYLPLLALASAGTLALRELRAPRTEAHTA